MTDSEKKTPPEESADRADDKEGTGLTDSDPTDQTSTDPGGADQDDAMTDAEISEPGEEDAVAAQEDESPAPQDDALSDIPDRPPVAEQPARRGGGFLATALGGVVAAAIGFGAAQFIGVDLLDGGSEDQAEAQTAMISTLEDRLTKLEDAPAPVAQPDADAGQAVAALQASISGELETVSTQISDVSTQMSALITRIEQLESRPPVIASGDGAASLAYEQELGQMRAALEEQRQKNEALASQVEEAASSASAELTAATENARALEQSAAMMRIQAAMESGGTFAGALAAFDGADIAPELQQAAATGVPTLVQLRESFTPAARAALSASLKSEMGDSATERLGAFLRSQVGARSLDPREGDDPDAVLSRAEAKVKSGDLSGALTEIQALPEAGQAAIADWVAQAQLRLTSTAAADALAASLN